MSIVGLSILLLSVLATYVGVAFFWRKSLQRKWFDIPNERSSHATPTPIGGGVVIVIVALITYLLISIFLTKNISFAYLLGAFLVALVSWIDDLYSLSVSWRLLAHVAAAFLLVMGNNYWTAFGVPALFSISLPNLGQWITIAWVVWMINAYNFMDGIDGISAIQGSVTAIAWSIVGSLSSQYDQLYPLALLGACVGFLVHNWPPAKIFMGDVGSAFLGFTFASMPFLFQNTKTNLALVPLATLLFLWPFVFDTTFTFFARLFNGERVWQAHRRHLYQRLVIAGHRHATVSFIYGTFAVFTAAVGLYILHPGAGDTASLLLLIGVLLTSFALTVVSMTIKRADPDTTKG